MSFSSLPLGRSAIAVTHLPYHLRLQVRPPSVERERKSSNHVSAHGSTSLQQQLEGVKKRRGERGLEWKWPLGVYQNRVGEERERENKPMTERETGR